MICCDGYSQYMRAAANFNTALAQCDALRVELALKDALLRDTFEAIDVEITTSLTTAPGLYPRLLSTRARYNQLVHYGY